MKKFWAYLSLNLFIINLLFSTNSIFPLEILQDNYEIKNISEKNRKSYEITFIYDIKKIKKLLKQDNFSIIITAPQSNTFQKTSIKSIENFKIIDIKKDSDGNNIIISDKIALSPEINSLKVTYEISRFYNNEKNLNYSNIVKINELIKRFKEDSNKNVISNERIYDEKIINFYPIPDDFYFYKALIFLNLISKENITGKICNAYFIPSGLDYFKNDFIIQLFIKEKYVMALDKYLNILDDNGNYIFNNYDIKNLKIISNNNQINFIPVETTSIFQIDKNKNKKNELKKDSNINEFQKNVLDKAYEFLDKAPYSQVIVNNKKFTLDCMGFISAIFYSIDFDLQKEISLYKGRNGVSKLFNYLFSNKMLHQNKIPSPGDIIIWDNTWDFNNDGLFGNDLLTHAGIVVKVEDDGTIHYVHVHVKNGVVVEKLNLYKPNQRFDDYGKEINSPMHAQSSLNFKKHLPYLSGELWKTNAVFLKKSPK